MDILTFEEVRYKFGMVYAYYICEEMKAGTGIDLQ